MKREYGIKLLDKIKQLNPVKLTLTNKIESNLKLKYIHGSKLCRTNVMRQLFIATQRRVKYKEHLCVHRIHDPCPSYPITLENKKVYAIHLRLACVYLYDLGVDAYLHSAYTYVQSNVRTATVYIHVFVNRE